MAKRIAVILSGCGHKDGTEITEAISTLIALTETGAEYQVFAPNQEFEVSHPVTSQPTGESRNIMVEAARIARGDVKDLKELKASEFDGVAFPGGYGAALHLCDWAQKGASCDVHPEAERILKEFYKEQKPIAAICIAPVLVARVLGDKGLTLTIGNDVETASEIEKTGAQHSDCPVTDFISDREHRIVSTPAYMFAQAKPIEVFTGVRKAIRELVEMA